MSSYDPHLGGEAPPSPYQLPAPPPALPYNEGEWEFEREPSFSERAPALTGPQSMTPKARALRTLAQFMVGYLALKLPELQGLIKAGDFTLAPWRDLGLDVLSAGLGGVIAAFASLAQAGAAAAGD